MPALLTRDEIVRVVAELPEDATLDDAIERLLFLGKIEAGMEEAQRGETLSHAEVVRRMEAQMGAWQK